MTDERMPLTELLQNAGEADFLRAMAESVLRMLMETDVEGLISAGRQERSAERLNRRSNRDFGSVDFAGDLVSFGNVATSKDTSQLFKREENWL